MLIADTLRRACVPAAKEQQTTFTRVNDVQNLDLLPTEIHDMQTATASDATLQCLLDTVKSGWPADKANIPACLHPYWPIRDEISYGKSLLLRGERIIVPTSCPKDIRDSLHDSAHLETDSCLRRPRDTVYWPGMNADLKAYVQSCATCAEYQPAQQPEPMAQPTKPSRPWEIVSSDMFTLNGKNYLITVDHYSGFFEADWLPAMNSKTVIKKLKAHFSRCGVPVKFLTDNARHLVSDDIEHFMRSWKCKHVTSSPYHPKGNATAEASVKTAKSLMRKSRDAYAALLTYRNTPKPDISLSPAQLFLMRRERTSLPTSWTLLVPKITKPPRAKVHQREHRIKKNYDCHAKALQTLHAGGSARMKPVLPNQKKWEKGTITKKLDHRS